MQILRNGSNGSKTCRGAAIAIGNFDGVHRGHQTVLRLADKAAASLGGPSAAMVFDPHPRAFFQPERPLFRLTGFELRAALMEALGLDCLVVMDFDRALSRLPAEKFVTDILLNDLGVAHVVIGYNFHFGQGRRGNAGLLRSMADEHGFGVTVAEPAAAGGEGSAVFSSTLIRQCLREGRPRDAAGLLGYWWTAQGVVIEGDRRGRTIGFPTANIALEDDAAPMFGVYAVRVRPEGGEPDEVWRGVANIGRGPTFGKADTMLEIHLFDFGQDIYGRLLIVEFIEFLRPERKFAGIDELTRQIGADSERARAVHDGLAAGGDPMMEFPLGRRFGAAP